MTAPATERSLLAAAREFNSGRYFEAHEALEEVLDDVPDEHWSLFLGLIRVAVGYHKATQPLRPGAARMLELGLETLAAYPAEVAGVDLESLRSQATRDLAALREGRLDASTFARRPPRLIVRKPAR